MRVSQIFNNASLYQVFQFMISKKRSRLEFRDQILKPNGVNSVLDFGCGNGNTSTFFLNSIYLGIEPLSQCVRKAIKHYHRDTTQFIVGNHLTLNTLECESFDLIIAVGVLHHIDDETARVFFRESRRLLKFGGRITTFDPHFFLGQGFLARSVISFDRGKFVRKESDYLALAEDGFSQVRTRKYSKLLRIPYDHLVIDFIK